MLLSVFCYTIKFAAGELSDRVRYQLLVPPAEGDGKRCSDIFLGDWHRCVSHPLHLPAPKGRKVFVKEEEQGRVGVAALMAD